MGLSVTDPIERAIDRTKAILFNPFQAGKWFSLGFCAFLAQLGNSCGNASNAFRSPGGSPNLEEDFQAILDPVKEWLLAHVALVVVGVVLLLLVGLALAWVQARGQFMFLDGVVRNCGEIAAPWKEYAREANGLFLFNLAFGVLLLLGLALIAGLGIALALPDIRAEEFSQRALLALLVGVPLLLLLLLAAAVIGVVLSDFVVPTMYSRRQGVLAAWGTVRREVLAGQVSTLVLYLLMKIVIAIAIGILAFLACCFTCCLALLPYLGTVILLPLFVFQRSYSLCFLEQLGPDWSLFPAEALPEAPAPEVEA